MESDFLFKITIAGEGGVGKTTLLNYYVNGVFQKDTSMTVGVQFFQKKVELKNQTYNLMFWDVGGQDRFKDLHTSYVGGSMGAILMFDLSRTSTLFQVDDWIKMLREKNEDIPILLVGSKYDLMQGDLNTERFSRMNTLALETKEKYDLFDYCITSAKIGYNIDHAFSILLDKVKNYYTIRAILGKLNKYITKNLAVSN
jgi:Ras-related protein Rab-11B